MKYEKLDVTDNFTIKVEGENSGENWVGIFKCKVRLSHRDILRRDAIRRELLGANPENASLRAITEANAFAELAVRLVDTPQWWKELDNGLELEDPNVVQAVIDEVEKIVQREVESRAKKVEEAKKILVSELETNPRLKPEEKHQA